MTIDEKVRKSLAELGVSDAAAVDGLFDKVRQEMEQERQELVFRGAADDKERERLCKGLRDRWLARRNGLISLIDDNWLKKALKDLKPVVGKQFNELRQAAAMLEVNKLIEQVSIRPAETWLPQSHQYIPPQPSSHATRAASGIVEPLNPIPDLTLPGYRRPLGSIHPITRVQREIEEIFLNLGFRIETGPEVESVYYNFDALNIPADHPARDDMDTLYVDPNTVLRTHTSPVQIRSMQKYGAPLYIIVPGRVYRRDNPDATHSPMFHQVEGLAIDTDISFADLKGTLDYFARKFFGEKVRTSFHPTFFPFTEPSGELSISCTICDGQGCSVCKDSGWIEVMGCGIVHPDVLRHGGVDPDRYSGWAFGLGVDRFAMMKYDINDIQLFFQSDLRFLQQF